MNGPISAVAVVRVRQEGGAELLPTVSIMGSFCSCSARITCSTVETGDRPGGWHLQSSQWTRVLEACTPYLYWPAWARVAPASCRVDTVRLEFCTSSSRTPARPSTTCITDKLLSSTYCRSTKHHKQVLIVELCRSTRAQLILLISLSRSVFILCIVCRCTNTIDSVIIANSHQLHCCCSSLHIPVQHILLLRTTRCIIRSILLIAPASGSNF